MEAPLIQIQGEDNGNEHLTHEETYQNEVEAIHQSSIRSVSNGMDIYDGSLSYSENRDENIVQEESGEEEKEEDIILRVDPLKQKDASSEDIEMGLKLIKLCRDKDLNTVQQYIHDGAPAGFITTTGWTPLAAAAYGGNSETVLYLLQISADKMYAKNTCTTATLEDATLAEIAIDERNDIKGFDHELAVNDNNRIYTTPLHWACYKGHVDAVLILLEWGFKVEDMDNIGNRPLHLACTSGDIAVVETLLAYCADVKPKNNFGNRPVDLATDKKIRKLLLNYDACNECEWCKDPFNFIKQRSLCQICHNVYCASKPCSSFTQSAPQLSDNMPISDVDNGAGNSQSNNAYIVGSRLIRYCQDCAAEMITAEHDLRSILATKLELVQSTLTILERNQRQVVEYIDKQPAIQERQDVASPEINMDSTPPNGKDDEIRKSDLSTANQNEPSPGKVSNASINAAISNSDNQDHQSNTPDDSSPISSPSINNQAMESKNSFLTNDELVRALTLQQTDAEALYTAIIAAESKSVTVNLIKQAKAMYQQFVSLVALQEEIKSLTLVRPISARSLIEPLKTALFHAQKENVSPTILSLAECVIQSAELECTLSGWYTFCGRLTLGDKKYRRDIARLEVSISDASKSQVDTTLLNNAIALRDRLNAEVALGAAQLQFIPEYASPEDATNGGTPIRFVFQDGNTVDTRLEALDIQFNNITTALDIATNLKGVSPDLIENGSTLLKQLRKDIRDETKLVEERRRLMEEAALKASKLGKKGKKKKK